MKLSIGQVSKIFDISKDTLRYYDKIGILKPEINSDNGYRYYLLNHLEKLQLILGIKYLGISLSDIKTTIESEDIEVYKELVVKQEDIIDRKIKELKGLKKGLNKTEMVLDTLNDFKNEYDFKNIEPKYKNYNLYGVDVGKILNSDLYKISGEIAEKEILLNEEESFYLYKTVKNEDVEEKEDLVFLKESENNINLIKKYSNENKVNFIKDNIDGYVISVDFYGNLKEIKQYILLLNKYFNGEKNNSIYINYKFYLPKECKDVVYFVNINLKI